MGVGVFIMQSLGGEGCFGKIENCTQRGGERSLWRIYTPESIKGSYYRSLQVDGKTIKAQIWDTAGQERYRAITSA